MPIGIVADTTHADLKQWPMEQRQHKEKPVVSEKIEPVEPPLDQEDHPIVEQEQPSEPETLDESERPFVSEERSDLEIQEIMEEPVTPEQLSKSETEGETVQKEPIVIKVKPPASPAFEQALPYVIKKRQPEVEKDETEEQPEKEKINVCCPQCKNIFTVEKEEGGTKIECPKCGKKGLIKY